MKPAELQHSGTHLIADLYGINQLKLTDASEMEAMLRQAALAAGATVIYTHFHLFGPGQGVTGVILLAESHISIHTWPEVGFAAVDIFMCGSAQPQQALAIIESALEPTSRKIKNIQRGYSVAMHN